MTLESSARSPFSLIVAVMVVFFIFRWVLNKGW
jgi:hypothetical protein